MDGTGSPWYRGDVGIRDGKIAAIGHLAGARAPQRTIDAGGMVVAPGFIDMLGQSELTILVDPHLPSKIFQGITTEITGEGNPIAPFNDAIMSADHVALRTLSESSPTGARCGEYFARLRKQGMGINLASYVGATQVAAWCWATTTSRADRGRTGAACRALVREAMRDGAVGVSTALQYAPAPYAKTEGTDRAGSRRRRGRRHLCFAHSRRGQTQCSRRLTKPFALAARRRFRWRSGT